MMMTSVFCGRRRQVFDVPDEPERHGEPFPGACYGTVANLTPK